LSINNLRSLLSTAWIALLISTASLQAAENASAYVPVGDPVYGFIERCISRELLPIWSINTRPVSRLTVGRLLKRAAIHYPRVKDQIWRADLVYYLREFAEVGQVSVPVPTESEKSKTTREIRMAGYNPMEALKRPHWHAAAFRTDRFSFVFDPLIWFRSDVGRDKSIFRRATGIQFRGDYNGRIGFYFRFVDHVERGNGPYDRDGRKKLLDDRYGYVGPLQGGSVVYYDLTEAYLTANLSGVELVFGKDRAAWGASRDGGLLLSGLSPSFNQFRLSTELFDKVRFSYLLGYLHAYDTPAYILYQTDHGWMRIARPDKWIVAHRVEYMPWESLVIAVNESVIWGDRGLDFAYMNPLNFYYSAEHDGGDHDNALMSGDIMYRFGGTALVYCELLIDDMKVSKLGSGDPSNKFGFLFGCKLLDMGLDGLRCGFEYMSINPYVYSHFFPVNRYSTWTSSLGSDIDPNSDRFRLWVNYHPIRSLGFDLKVDQNRSGETGSNLAVPLPPEFTGEIHFLDGNPDSWITIETAVKWEPLTSVFLRAGWINQDKRSIVPDRFYLELGYRY